MARTPLTAYQRDVWAANSNFPDNPQFNCQIYDRFQGDVDLGLLAECLHRAAAASDAFRLRFDDADGTPYQWLADAPEVRTVDLTAEADPAAACEQWIRDSFDRPFDLRRARTSELTLLRESDTVVHAHVKAHHIVADAWGLYLFMARVRADYEHVLRTGTPSAAEAPQYFAFARDEEAYRASAEHRADREFFREAMAGAAPEFFPRKEASGARRSARHSFLIERALIDRMRERGASVFSFVSAAFAVYLARVLRTDEVVIGVPLLNRPTDAQKATVGHFANTLPLRVRPDGGRTMDDLVAEVRAATRALKPRERLALGDLLRELPLHSSDGPRRLFDVTIAHLRWPRPLEIPGVTYDTVVQARAHDTDALAVVVNELDDVSDVLVDMDHGCDVFDEDFPVEAAGRHIKALIERALDAPDRPLATLPMLDDAERTRLVHTVNDTARPYAADRTVHGLFEEQAARTPDRVAVVADATGESLTYAELDARADRIARVLRDRGVTPGDRVAVLMERGPSMPAAILGVLKSGGAYTPVDPGYPAERIAFLIADSGAKAVLVAGDARPAGDVPVLDVDALPEPSGAPLEASATSHDPAYVIYTSGSTGKPKGAVVEHHSVVNRLQWMQRGYPVGEGDVLLQKTPISFDVSVWELFWWAFEGAGLALLPPGAEKDPREMLRTVARRRVSVVHFVPSMFAGFLDLLEDAPELRADAASLRYVFCSGEALPPALVDRFNRLFAGPGAPRLVNLYGPTEATVDVSYFDCPADAEQPVRRVPIGRPIDNIRLYVLDRDGNPQPAGAPGELCIAGAGVARGYLNRPELTAEKFTEDPFVPDGGRMYRTGDLARRLADGAVEYLGRIDGQVKIRGNRVELGEVQDRLATCPGVRAAAVCDHRTADRGTFLVGYYTADADLDPAHLRAHLAGALPEYMIPAYFRRLDTIPLTPNGKTDRRALPAPELADAAYEEPRDATEAALAAVWAEVLGVERVGIRQNYYALGGDSILMLRIRALAERRGIRFALADLVRNPTVAGLAEHAGTAAPGAEVTELAPFALVPSVDRPRLAQLADAFPATRLQLGLLYHSRENDNTAVYHDVFRYSLKLPWDEAALRAAFARLTERHPVLRSGFALAGFSEPLQTVHHAVQGGLETADLRALPPQEAEARIQEHIRERRFHPYDFENPPLYLFRAHALADSVELVLSFHHAILDGWSVATLVRELLQDCLHAAGEPVEAVPGGPLPSAAHYALDERRALRSEEAKRFWQHRLAGAEALQLDGFRPYEKPGTEGVFAHHVELPDGLGAALRGLARDRGVPVKSVLFAAHCLLLRLAGGTDDVLTGLVMHGRPERAGSERVTGLFLGTTPVRIGPGPRTWLDVVREAHLQEQETHPHRHYPLSAIQEDRGGDTVIETAFNYVHLRVLTELLTSTSVELLDFRTYEETNFKLLVNAVVDPADERIWLRMDHDGRTFTRSQAEFLGRTYLALLRRIVERPDEPAGFGFLAGSATPVIPERRAALPDHVVRRFDAQVARTPDAVAVAFEDERWTYRRLGEAADRVARRLLALGAGPGARIGLAMDRSPETIAAVLGVAKAGAACVPMDVTYPEDRLALMVERAAPFRVITHERHTRLFPGAEVLLLDDALAAPAPGREPVPLPEITGETVAYILFTSGSSGEPKGVVLPHRTLANYMEWQIPAPSGAAGGKTLQFAPLSFDVSFQEIYSTLCGGGTLQLIAESERRDMPALLRLLDREAVERVFLPYVALQQLAEASEALGIRPHALRVIVSSGEQLRVTDEIRRFCAGLPGTVLENQYGPTETHLLTHHTMTGDPADFPALPPIGVPFAGVELHLLDADLKPVPQGAKGTLHVGGVALAHGYLGRPDLTDERFVPHPTEPGERLYRTGDLARVLPGGDLVWLGREDSQVKVRGYRVELAEIELALTKLAEEHTGIREVAVVARRRDGADAFLAAFLVGDEGSVSLDELTAGLRRALPDYMVPSHYEWLDKLPLTPSGKRDDAALRRTALTSRAGADRVPPRDAHERALAGVLSELLQVPDVGTHDDFFALGGTSLTAMRLVVTIEKLYGVNVPLSALVGAPTVAALAGLLREREAGVAFDPVVPIRREGSRPPLFLVHPLGGNVLCYLKLAEHLPADQPVYALQAAGTHPGTEPGDSVPGIAARYLEAVRRVRPEGPYVIGGWSFGGFIAFEMARQLRLTHPEDVESLLLIDPIAVAPGERPSVTDDSLLEWFFWELLWMERGGTAPVESLPEGLDSEGKFDFVVERAVDAGILPSDSSRTSIRRLFAMFKAHWHALLTYRPDLGDRPDQDLVLLRATSPLPKVLEPMHGAAGSLHEDVSNGWQDLTGGHVEVVDVPGDHLVLLEEPHVAGVAEQVLKALGESTENTTGSGDDGR
ncbi:non-ribosomal peptide synthetase [Streptomyces griseocarneus]|nr:non-ribosomal peptide synthetase [Streptomyces griseocarneus]